MDVKAGKARYIDSSEYFVAQVAKVWSAKKRHVKSPRQAFPRSSKPSKQANHGVTGMTGDMSNETFKFASDIIG